MLAEAGSSWTSAITALVALLGALLALLQYTNWKTRRDRIAQVAEAFDQTVEALASDSEVRRLAAAIRLRRFFDKRSEVGSAGAAYAQDAIDVAAGVLREQESGNFQKLLADGLAYAPSLRGADLQRTNLQGAYLAAATIEGADFFHADLSGASLKRANAAGAQFVEAKLVGTVLTEADLTNANFSGADLTGARFGGASVAGARFRDCTGAPGAIRDHLDDQGTYGGPDPLPADVSPVEPDEPKVFLSRPSVLTSPQATVLRGIQATIAAAGATVVEFDRPAYSKVGVLDRLRTLVDECDGVVVVGLRQMEVGSGRWRTGTAEETSLDGTGHATPWNQVEAGIAAGLGKPIFVVREGGVAGGIFDLPADATTTVVDLHDALNASGRSSLQEWAGKLERAR